MSVTFDITPYLQECKCRISKGESLRMIAKDIGICKDTLSKHLKANGVQVPTRIDGMKNVWKNHTHPRIGKKGPDCPVYGKKMSEATRKKMRPIWDEIGDQRRHYRKKHSDGYICVYLPNNHAADRGGYVLEHRAVMENHFGRLLSQEEVVHHKNGDKKDNRIENLVVVTRSEHINLHRGNGGKANA